MPSGRSVRLSGQIDLRPIHIHDLAVGPDVRAAVRVGAEEELTGPPRDDRARNRGQIAMLLRREAGRQRLHGALAEDARQAVAPTSEPLLGRAAPARLLRRAIAIRRSAGGIAPRPRRR